MVVNTEIDKFEKIAAEWWKSGGSFDMLHQINPIRINYIKQIIFENFPPNSQHDFSDLNILDAGTGGGLASISLAKLKARVDAIDAGQKNIDAAQNYAKLNDVNNINFICSAIENFCPDKLYDVIICLEVLEHVENPKATIAHLSSLLKENGIIFVSTLDKSYISWLMSIFIAENILNFLPQNTHEYDKFISPKMLVNLFVCNNLKALDIKGLNWHPEGFKISKMILSNYIISAKKV
ncbi:MAG: bifunctional 2-polyprenyl-6-hydroxyphenol methylase/3-demethylubiquinol 3-O-methyltransferase UbiG [Rickettsiaceae bacterium]|nr:bifunctional 2-polyprenyl-6-hydroxyphenol methylase/3-demethylubiquinol 3-O-methyltransferase UbiG [Rickettsiaceae bacterium]